MKVVASSAGAAGSTGVKTVASSAGTAGSTGMKVVASSAGAAGSTGVKTVASSAGAAGSTGAAGSGLREAARWKDFAPLVAGLMVGPLSSSSVS